MPGPVFRRGETVELRTTEKADAEFLQRIVNDPRVRTGLGSFEPINGPAEEEWIESLGDRDGVHFVVAVDGDAVGTIGLDDLNEVWGTAELGYMIAPAHWGHGYATDATRAICGYAFEERRIEKVVAKAYETNPASCRVLEKAGFEREGRLRREAFVDGERVDVVRFGLLADEYAELDDVGPGPAEGGYGTGTVDANSDDERA
jgi:RimJ/RimL family protein N-acetyltransferase